MSIPPASRPARRRLRGWSHLHELFHALVITANALLFAFVVIEVVHH